MNKYISILVLVLLLLSGFSSIAESRTQVRTQLVWSEYSAILTRLGYGNTIYAVQYDDGTAEYVYYKGKRLLSTSITGGGSCGSVDMAALEPQIAAYDANGDGMIQKSESDLAVSDYTAGRITNQVSAAIFAAYLESCTIVSSTQYRFCVGTGCQTNQFSTVNSLNAVTCGATYWTGSNSIGWTYIGIRTCTTPTPTPIPPTPTPTPYIPSPTPTVPGQVAGSVTITSSPSAGVYLNNVYLGNTPYSSSYTPGAYNFVVKLTGYYECQKSVTISSGVQTSATCTLLAMPTPTPTPTPTYTAIPTPTQIQQTPTTPVPTPISTPASTVVYKYCTTNCASQFTIVESLAMIPCGATYWTGNSVSGWSFGGRTQACIITTTPPTPAGQSWIRQLLEWILSFFGL